MVDRPRVPEVAKLQGDADERVPLLLAPPGEGGSYHAEVRAAQAAAGGVLLSLGLEPDMPEWELSQVLKFLASPKIRALEDQEQEGEES